MTIGDVTRNISIKGRQIRSEPPVVGVFLFIDVFCLFTYLYAKNKHFSISFFNQKIAFERAHSFGWVSQAKAGEPQPRSGENGAFPRFIVLPCFAGSRLPFALDCDTLTKQVKG